MGKRLSDARKNYLVERVLCLSETTDMRPKNIAAELGINAGLVGRIQAKGRWPNTYYPSNAYSVPADFEGELPEYRAMRDDPNYIELMPRQFMRRDVFNRYPGVFRAMRQ